MTTELFLAFLRQWHHAGTRNLLAFEALVDAEPEDERIARTRDSPASWWRSCCTVL